MVHDTITGADGDKFLQNITHHYWKDNGQGVGSLFSWTGDPAVVQGPEEGIAAETAHVYSSYIGTDQELLHLPGNHTLGQVNPNWSNVGEKASGTTSSSAKSSASFAPPPPSINAPDRAHRKSSGVLAEIPHL